MPLSCLCDDEYAWFYDMPDGYHNLDTSRRKRCASCNTLIEIGAITALFSLWRYPNDDIEARIYGDDGEISLANLYHCEVCADLFFSLYELGFDCISPNENMKLLVREYQNKYLKE